MVKERCWNKQELCLDDSRESTQTLPPFFFKEYMFDLMFNALMFDSLVKVLSHHHYHYNHCHYHFIIIIVITKINYYYNYRNYLYNNIIIIIINNDA